MPVPGTKLRVPALRRQLVQRQRLIDLLSAKNSLPRLMLVAAPAGFGKTTLLSQWLAHDIGTEEEVTRVAWLSLDSSDADLKRFLTDLVAAVQGCDAGLAGDALALLEGTRTLPSEDILASIINDIDELEGRIVIVLDDYHLADAPAVHEAVMFLLDHLPPSATVAMTTRADPPFPLARLRTRGELLEIRAADLRFTPSEADAFLNEVMDLQLQEAAVAALESRTEGWAAGLQLAALSVRAYTAAGEVDEFVEAFSGTNRFVLDYLVEEVLASQPDEVRDFLVTTSVLSHLTGDLCDAVTGRKDGGTTLAALERSNLFVVPLDEQRQWYRYHHLFADALRARSQSVDRVKELHARASHWYAQQGMLPEALTHADASGDHQRTADLFELALAGMRKSRHDQAILDGLAILPPDEVRSRPLLAAVFAWSRLVDGDLAGVAEWLDSAEAGLSTGGALAEWSATGPLAEIKRERDRELRMLPATIAVYRASVAQARGDIAGTVALAEVAQKLADPSDHLARAAAAGFLGLAAWAAGDLPTAVATFGACVDRLHQAGNLADELGSSVVLAHMFLDLGRPDDARQLYEHKLEIAEASPRLALPITGDLQVGLADVMREHGDLAAAAQHLRLARELGESASLPENRHRWYLAMARLLVSEGDRDGAVAMFDEAEQRYLPGFFPDVRPIPAARARVWIAQGNLTRARRWARQHRAAALDPNSYLDEYNQLTLARLWVAEHRTGVAHAAAAAIDLLSSIIEAAGDERVGGLIEARMVRALAHASNDALDSALTDIRAAIGEGVPAGYRRLFLDEGQPLIELLQLLRSSGSAHDVELVQQLVAAEPASRMVASITDDSLSERELEVLALLATDLTGPEIARHLYISINTLRTHTKRIFTKLNVNTRRAAVSKAKDLGLL